MIVLVGLISYSPVQPLVHTNFVDFLFYLSINSHNILVELKATLKLHGGPTRGVSYDTFRAENPHASLIRFFHF
jgi:hypothetical protein